MTVERDPLWPHHNILLPLVHATDETDVERCGFSWSWPVFDGFDSETCGSTEVVGHDLDTYEPRCPEHLEEVMAQTSYGPRRREPIRICD